MKVATHDRGEVLNLAGTQHLSPAIQDGAPRLAGEGENAGRVGWEAFFSALDRAGLLVSWDTDEPASARAVPAAEGRPLERHGSLAAGVDRARRFLAAWRGAQRGGGNG
jgi:hypothetical protein